jgi:hypothetical protein
MAAGFARRHLENRMSPELLTDFAVNGGQGDPLYLRQNQESATTPVRRLAHTLSGQRSNSAAGRAPCQ